MHCLLHSVPQPCSRPLLTHASAGNSCTLMGKSGSVSCGATAPFSSVLVHIRFCLCSLQRSVSPVRVSSGSSMVGLMATSSKKANATARSAAPRAPASVAGHSWPILHRRHSNTQRQVWLSLCGISWWAQVFVWALRASLVGMVFDSKHNFAPPTILWGFSFAVGHRVSFFVGIQQWLVILEFLQEKMSTFAGYIFKKEWFCHDSLICYIFQRKTTNMLKFIQFFFFCLLQNRQTNHSNFSTIVFL